MITVTVSVPEWLVLMLAVVLVIHGVNKALKVRLWFVQRRLDKMRGKGEVVQITTGAGSRTAVFLD